MSIQLIQPKPVLHLQAGQEQAQPVASTQQPALDTEMQAYALAHLPARADERPADALRENGDLTVEDVVPRFRFISLPTLMQAAKERRAAKHIFNTIYNRTPAACAASTAIASAADARRSTSSYDLLPDGVVTRIAFFAEEPNVIWNVSKQFRRETVYSAQDKLISWTEDPTIAPFICSVTNHMTAHVCRTLSKKECTNKVLECSSLIKQAQDKNLNLFFDRLLPSISEEDMSPALALIGDEQQRASAIRTWMHSPIGQVVLRRIKTLDLSYANLTMLPGEIGLLVNLQHLKLNDNQLIELPEAIGQLVHLKILKCSHNRLVTLPEAIGKLVNLHNLDCQSNHLTTLPAASIGKLVNLYALILDHNRLQILPEEIGRLGNLIALRVSCNRLTTLPESISRLCNLSFLRVDRNRLRTLPEAVCKLDKLEELDISENLLETLPEAIGWLSSLRRLVLGHNALQTLPAIIGQFHKLIHLDISHNNLHELPEEIGQLSMLQRLFVLHNNLAALPATITQLGNLRSLDVRENLPLQAAFEAEDPVEEIPDAIRAFILNHRR